MQPRPPTGTPVYAPVKAEAHDPFGPEQALAAVSSLLPVFSNNRKTEWLQLKSIGFSQKEASYMAGVDLSTVKGWKRDDPLFAEWEQKVLTIRTRINNTLLDFNFSRNMYMALQFDFKLLRKAMFSPNGAEDLTDMEQKLLLKATDRYKTTDLLAMLKVLEPERDQGNGGLNVGEMHVHVDGDLVIAEAAKKAAATELLKQFLVNNEIIEGDFRVSTDSDGSDSDS